MNAADFLDPAEERFFVVCISVSSVSCGLLARNLARIVPNPRLTLSLLQAMEVLTCSRVLLSGAGNGEQGKPFPMTDADRVDQAYRENGFNIYVSDRISLNRSVPDIRHPK